MSLDDGAGEAGEKELEGIRIVQLGQLDEVTISQAAHHCSSAAVWFWVRLPVITSASIASPCDTVQFPINCSIT